MKHVMISHIRHALHPFILQDEQMKLAWERYVSESGRKEDC